MTSAELKAANERAKTACQGGCSQLASKKFENVGGQQYQVFDSPDEVDHEYLDDSRGVLERRLAGQDTGVGRRDMEVNLIVSVWGWLQGGGIVQHDNYECAPGVTCYPNHPVPAKGDPDAL